MPTLRDAVLPPAAPESGAWSLAVPDARHGAVRLTGRLDVRDDARAVVLIVHGLGGDAERPYVARAAGAARRRPEGRGPLPRRPARDLSAALGSPELAGYERRYVLGFSIGGHIALRLALDGTGKPDAVATVCAPLDLEASQRRLDAGGAHALYRSWLLSGLRAHYRELVERDRAPAPWDAVRAIRTIRAWDDTVVAPRFDFGDAARYYAEQAVGERVADVAVRTLCVVARNDPMVDAAPLLERVAPGHRALTLRVVERGGHVGFPRDLDLGLGPVRGLDAQVMTWFLQSDARIPAS